MLTYLRRIGAQLAGFGPASRLVPYLFVNQVFSACDRGMCLGLCLALRAFGPFQLCLARSFLGSSTLHSQVSVLEPDLLQDFNEVVFKTMSVGVFPAVSPESPAGACQDDPEVFIRDLDEVRKHIALSRSLQLSPRGLVGTLKHGLGEMEPDLVPIDCEPDLVPMVASSRVSTHVPIGLE
ncbi:hypothetical protein CFP71_14665 [Amycolatopsis thailandensis]|uniref:Uncharacterized protein n=1 Tax=Amycolatopsis thailandensis TaxID=589330 RepID=A0A229SBV2_9PSEU|nr:hypothetical protein CFP71_14665 [Amycolatopsis thailandensis]